MGFEPTERSSRSEVFKTSAFNHSATHPRPLEFALGPGAAFILQSLLYHAYTVSKLSAVVKVAMTLSAFAFVSAPAAEAPG